jgi:hypothetical protein
MFPASDHDYVIKLMRDADITPEERESFLAVYSWFMSAGVAAYIASLPPSQQYDAVLAEYPAFHRAFERRHFRGDKGRLAILDHREKHPESPGKGLRSWFAGGDWDSFCSTVQDVKMMGPYIRFLIYDMAQNGLEHLNLAFIPTTEIELYESPQAGARILALPGEDILATTRRLLEELKHVKVYGRNLEMQEIETLFCRYKKWARGTYKVGDDKVEAFHDLRNHGRDSRIARAMFKAGEFDDYTG